jgi:hypothetical protein
MTHDELLVRLMVLDGYESEQTRLSKTTQALRTIVELHKPVKSRFELGEEYLACSACEEDTNVGAYQVAYPCPTIQSIQKELA